jgi:hypothetical protein
VLSNGTIKHKILQNELFVFANILNLFLLRLANVSQKRLSLETYLNISFITGTYLLHV